MTDAFAGMDVEQTTRVIEATANAIHATPEPSPEIPWVKITIGTLALATAFFSFLAGWRKLRP